ncbi:MAG: copper resistance CopC family protein [bacterium]
MLKIVLGFLVAVAIAGSLPAGGVIWSHGKLLRSEPAPDSTVKTAPRVVRAWFNDELDAKRSTISVTDARGRRVDDGKGGVDLQDMDRKSMIARLKPAAPGSYTVTWKAVSVDDGFVAKGSYRFKIAPK